MDKKLTLSLNEDVIEKANKYSKQSNTSLSKLIKYKAMVVLLELNDKITELALSDESFNDFEDALQYYTAIENEIDIIITRNKKDFKNSRLPVLSAKEYLSIKN
jgi:predicted nucleic acid-binding protein